MINDVITKKEKVNLTCIVSLIIFICVLLLHAELVEVDLIPIKILQNQYTKTYSTFKNKNKSTC